MTPHFTTYCGTEPGQFGRSELMYKSLPGFAVFDDAFSIYTSLYINKQYTNEQNRNKISFA